MHPEVEKHLDEIRAVAERYGVDRLEIFGSAMTDAFDPARSDVDFIVHYPEGYEFGYFIDRYFRLEEDLATVLGREAELVMTSALKHDSFRSNADRTRMTVYLADKLDSVTLGNSEAMPTHH